MKEGTRIRRTIFDFSTNKSFMIETTYEYPIGLEASYRVFNFLNERLISGKIRKMDAYVNWEFTDALEKGYSYDERKAIIACVIREADAVLELPEVRIPEYDVDVSIGGMFIDE